MSHCWAPECQQSLVSSVFADSSCTLLPAAQHRSPLPAWWCCLWPQCSCCLPVPGVVTLSELLWAQEGPSTALETSHKPTWSFWKWAAPCRWLCWGGVVLAFSPLSSDTLTAPALSGLQTGAAKGWLLPWKPHLVAFLSGFAPAGIQAISRLHYKGLINHSHKASTQECWLPMLMNAFNVAILVTITPIQPHGKNALRFTYECKSRWNWRLCYWTGVKNVLFR